MQTVRLWFALGQIANQKREEICVDPLDPSLMTVPIIVEGETSLSMPRLR